MTSPEIPPDFRSGYIAVLGKPNVGKSTFLNAVLGTKLSIVSPKPQTTREAIRGILNGPGYQAVFVDTPGWLTPSDGVQITMRKHILRTIYDDADVALWLIEPGNLSDEEKALAGALKKAGKSTVVGVNKIDRDNSLVGIGTSEAAVKDWLGIQQEIVRISAKTGQGIADLSQRLISFLPVSPPYFPQDQITDRWERAYVGELIREVILARYHEEIPHASAVVVEDFVERPGRKDHIQANVIVETEGQKKILIGKGGQAIKGLSQAARLEIEKRLGRPVYLELTIKVHKNWRKDPRFLETFF